MTVAAIASHRVWRVGGALPELVPYAKLVVETDVSNMIVGRPVAVSARYLHPASVSEIGAWVARVPFRTDALGLVTAEAGTVNAR